MSLQFSKIDMNANFLRKMIYCGALSLQTLLALPVAASEPGATKQRTNLPPSADLGYLIRAKQSGIAVEGEAHMTWTSSEGRYQVTTVSRAMLLGRILDAKSEGLIDDYGLAPLSFTEKRLRRDATTTTFNRDSKDISFSTSTEHYPIKGGEQDRNSAVWQLIAMARATPAKFKDGAEWTFLVAGQRDAEPWTFRVAKQEKLATPFGELDTWRVVKSPPPDRKGQQVELWLAPGVEWYPARIRYTDHDGDYIEQSLATVTKKVP